MSQISYLIFNIKTCVHQRFQAEIKRASISKEIKLFHKFISVGIINKIPNAINLGLPDFCKTPKNKAQNLNPNHARFKLEVLGHCSHNSKPKT